MPRKKQSIDSANASRSKADPKAPLPVENASDPLERETSVAAILEENGLRVKAKSRAVAAFDRLLGNIVDYPSALIEPGLAQRRARLRLEEELRQIAHDKIVAAELDNRDVGNVYLERYKKEQMTYDKNKINIGKIAIEDLRNIPPAEDKTDKAEIDEDWLTEFVELARKKGNPDIQTIWGRMLAGKIREPNATKLRDIQKLASLDVEDVKRINSFLLCSLNNEFVFRLGETNIECLKFREVLAMEDLGIANSQSTTTLNSELKAGNALTFYLCGDVLRISSIDDYHLMLPVYPLTSFGKTLSKLIRVEPTPLKYISEISATLSNPSIKIEYTPIIINEKGEPCVDNDDWRSPID